ncbi:MAG: SAM-dependent methyltransferase [Spirochaetota bacterium]
MIALADFLDSLDLVSGLAQAVATNPRKGLVSRGGETCSRIRIKPIVLRDVTVFQAELQCGEKAYHEQIPVDDIRDSLLEWMAGFKQLSLFTDEADYQVLVNRMLEATVAKHPPSKARVVAAHDRRKVYLLEEGVPVPFLVNLGVMDAEGRVFRKKHDKFRQVNKYLEFMDHAIAHLPKDRPLRIADFGCGKAYLSFALHHYLTAVLGLQADIVGLDLKDDVIRTCSALTSGLSCKGLHFMQGDIADYRPTRVGATNGQDGQDSQDSQDGRPDMIVSLHACDTASDEAIAKGIEWGCAVILAVPCCQHEFFDALRNPAMQPVIRHGVAREKQSTLVTDASRVLMLEAFGYRTEMVEFIDLEHTPKNVLIRAYRDKPGFDPDRYAAYRSFLDSWGIGQTFLENSLASKGLLALP